MNSDGYRPERVTRHTNVVEEGVRAEKAEASAHKAKLLAAFYDVSRELTETFRYSYDKDGDRL